MLSSLYSKALAPPKSFRLKISQDIFSLYLMRTDSHWHSAIFIKGSVQRSLVKALCRPCTGPTEGMT
ncbi:unnamed protein product [Moneuplotes crassus]|uniref:Uncharacterized protein n=1 Tax=Euplotes crassus TaxID=5936 RepID=A0AAD1UKX3_EUPCR|nr:unnamed protein product [Moneuplotes crassus]